MSERVHFKNLPLERLRERFVADGVAAYRADQVASWLYQHGVDDPAAGPTKQVEGALQTADGQIGAMDAPLADLLLELGFEDRLYGQRRRNKV